MNPWIDVFGWSIVGAAIALIVLVEIPHIRRVWADIQKDLHGK